MATNTALTTIWPQGNTATAWPITCQNGQGASASAQDLTFQTAIGLTFASSSTPSVYTALTGTATITNATAGQFNWFFSTADVATPATGMIVVTVTLSTGKVWKSLPMAFQIIETG